MNFREVTIYLEDKSSQGVGIPLNLFERLVVDVENPTEITQRCLSLKDKRVFIQS